jgi:hypothetical protein
MDLQEAVTMARSVSSPQDETICDVLSKLAQSASQAHQAYALHQDITAQHQLEKTFLYLLHAFERFDLDPQRCLYRAIASLQRFNGERAFHILPDRVEIRVGQICKGGWPIYTQEDYDQALALALEMNATIHHEEGKQLELFQA